MTAVLTSGLPVFGALGLLALVVGNVWLVPLAVGRWFWVRKRLERLRGVMSRAGFEVQSHNWLLGWTLEGKDLGRAVRVRAGLRKVRGQWRWRKSSFELEDVQVPSGFVAADRGAEPSGWRGATRLVTGDYVFDRAVAVHGDLAVARAALSQEARAALEALVSRGGGYVDNGLVGLERGGAARDEGLMMREIHALERAAETLNTRGRSLPRALADNACEDANVDVRLGALKTLLARFGETPEAREAARRTLSRHGGAARLLAARFLGDEGVPALGTLILDGQVDVSVRRLALKHLVARGGADRVVGVLAALRCGAEALAADAASAVVAAQISYLAGAEEALVGLLAADSGETRVVACKALGQVGSLGAVETLKPLTEGLFRSGELKRAAQEAVEAIQARAHGGAYGQLSLADGGGLDGALSLPGGGGLSLAEPADG